MVVVFYLPNFHKCVVVTCCNYTDYTVTTVSLIFLFEIAQCRLCKKMSVLIGTAGSSGATAEFVRLNGCAHFPVGFFCIRPSSAWSTFRTRSTAFRTGKATSIEKGDQKAFFHLFQKVFKMSIVLFFAFAKKEKCQECPKQWKITKQRFLPKNVRRKWKHQQSDRPSDRCHWCSSWDP